MSAGTDWLGSNFAGPAGPSEQQVALEQHTLASKEVNSNWIALGSATPVAEGTLFVPYPLPSDKTSGVLYPVLGSSVQGGHGFTWNKTTVRPPRF